MRIEAAPRRRRMLSLTSLIDVIFLLLLFFMLSSTFTRFAAVEIAAGEAGSGAAPAPDILVRLSAEGWTINGRAVAEAEAGAELARLEAAGARQAVVLVRGEATSQALVSAVERIRAETDLSVSVGR